jgi:hypothetical protein
MQTGDKAAIGFVFGILLLGLGAVVATRDTSPMPERESMSAVNVAALPTVVTISEGEEIEIPPYLQAGKKTILEFTAKW